MGEVGPGAKAELPQIDGITLIGEAWQGSVQTHYPVSYQGYPGQEFLVARATDGYSVFDVGTIGEIAGAGTARNTLRHQVFTALGDPATWQALNLADVTACFSDSARAADLMASHTLALFRTRGALTHHMGIIDPTTHRVIVGPTDIHSDMVLVRRYPVITPARTALAGTVVYNYHSYAEANSKVMALEHVVRLGNPGGSSLQDRYNKLMTAGDEAGVRKLLQRYGLEQPLIPWSRLPNMTFDWTTKYEPRDRHVSLQEVEHLSGVSDNLMTEAVDVLTLATIYTRKHFANLGLHLWDLKWEVAVDGGSIIIADTLDHDSMRVTASVEYEPSQYCHVHFNKQAIRDYLRIFHPDWYAALEDAKLLSAQEGTQQDFMELYNEGVAAGRYPSRPELDPEFAELQSLKYEFVTSATTGTDRQVAARGAQALGRAEVEYYRRRGKLDEFLKRNAVLLK